MSPPTDMFPPPLTCHPSPSWWQQSTLAFRAKSLVFPVAHPVRPRWWPCAFALFPNIPLVFGIPLQITKTNFLDGAKTSAVHLTFIQLAWVSKNFPPGWNAHQNQFIVSVIFYAPGSCHGTEHVLCQLQSHDEWVSSTHDVAKRLQDHHEQETWDLHTRCVNIGVLLFLRHKERSREDNLFNAVLWAGRGGGPSVQRSLLRFFLGSWPEEGGIQRAGAQIAANKQSNCWQRKRPWCSVQNVSHLAARLVSGISTKNIHKNAQHTQITSWWIRTPCILGGGVGITLIISISFLLHVNLLSLTQTRISWCLHLTESNGRRKLHIKDTHSAVIYTPESFCMDPEKFRTQHADAYERQLHLYIHGGRRWKGKKKCGVEWDIQTRALTSVEAAPYHVINAWVLFVCYMIKSWKSFGWQQVGVGPSMTTTMTTRTMTWGWLANESY